MTLRVFLTCTTCAGEPERVEYSCPFECSGSRTPMGCTHMVEIVLTCPDCLGSGHEQCVNCDEAPAEVLTEWGPYCVGCALEAKAAA